MNVKDVRTQLFEELKVGRGVVDEGTAFGGGEDFAAQDEGVVIFGIVAFEERL